MAGSNKLLAEIDGRPVLRRVLDAATASGASPVLVVTGHEREAVEAVAAPGETGVGLVHNPDYARGMSTSLARGIGALPPEVEAAFVCLGDMPRVKAEHLRRLASAFRPERGCAICIPVYRGRRGNPVLWARRYFTEMQDLAGDRGARELIAEHADAAREVEMDDDGIFVDVDTPGDLAAVVRDP